MEKQFWKVWLRLNLLTKDVENDYTAEVSTSKNTLRNEDIARRIIAEGSEIKYDTLLSVLNQADRITREAILQGYSVMTGNCQLTPRVSGSWIGAAAQYNPAAHKTTCDLVATKALRDALAGVGIEVLGVRDSGAYIGLVTNTATGLTDGAIREGDDLLIEGDKIRIAPLEDAITGIYFVMPDGRDYKVERKLVQNDPKRVVCRVPKMTIDTYPQEVRLEIRTQFTSGDKLLKEIRTIEYGQLLSVQEP